MTNQDILAKMYPTKESLLEERKKHASWAKMATAIKIGRDSLYFYRKKVGIEVKDEGKRIFLTEITQAKVDERMAEFKSDSNVFRRYKITDPETFYANPLGYDGLQFISEEHGTTWRNIEFSNCGVEL